MITFGLGGDECWLDCGRGGEMGRLKIILPHLLQIMFLLHFAEGIMKVK